MDVFLGPYLFWLNLATHSCTQKRDDENGSQGYYLDKAHYERHKKAQAHRITKHRG